MTSKKPPTRQRKKAETEMYDPACRDLAIIFLRDEPGMNADDEIELAKQFQEAAEDFIDDVQAWRRLEK